MRRHSVVQRLEQINDAGGVGGARGQQGWSKILEEAEATKKKQKQVVALATYKLAS